MIITGELKNKIDKIWEIFWTGGITNPLSVIEQFTYLIFIKLLDDKQLRSERDAILLGIEPKKFFNEEQQNLRWSNFKELEAQKMYDTMVNEDLALEGDIKGNLYEYLLSKLATSGTNGQFRTPRHIIDMMVKLVKPVPTDMIIDPACGTSGFLVGAGEYLKENHNEIFNSEELKNHYQNNMFYGNDMDTTMLRIGTMNMMLHDIENPDIDYKDSLAKSNTDKEKYTLVLANPPFKGSLDAESVADDILKITKTKKTELLFLALMIRILKNGGRCAVIVPDGVLFGASNAHKQLRKEIIENHILQGIISMPSGVFKPYAGVSTAVLLFTKTGVGGTDKVWFYDMQADGYSLDDKRTKIEDNDIEDIINRFSNLENETSRKRTEKSFLVSKEEIVENDYDLSINKYKEIEYEEIVYEKPEVIIGKIKELEKEITLGLEELEKLVK